MKKLLSFALAFTLVLSLSVAAYAAGSPTKIPTVEDLPTEVAASVVPTVGARIIPNADLSEDQKDIVDKALAEVTEEGYLPVNSFYVEADCKATIVIPLDEGTVVFLIYRDDSIVKIPVEDLVARSDGDYEIPVSGSCIVVIAKEA